MSASKYANALNEGRELTKEFRQARPTLFREELVSKAVRAIGAGRSVLFVGPAGVGKTSVIRALAGHLVQTGPRKLYEFATVQLLSGTVYLGEWQSKVTALFQGAADSKALLYFTDIWNLPSAGRSSNRDDTIWDALRPRLQNHELQVVGEVDETQHLALAIVPGFEALFEVIEVRPLSTDQISQLVIAEAKRLSIDMDARAISRLLELCDHFLPVSSGPGPALRLLEQIKHYRNEKRGVGEDEEATAAFVEKIFSVYTGLPRFIVGRDEVRPVAEIRDWFRSRIVGQREAIEAVVQTITLFKAGLHDARRPIGTMLFVGPTGVGKTELARALATFLFGSEKRLLRFDLSEFKDYHSFEMLIGDPKKPERPARLVDPVRAQPFQVILLDEIEKAHPNIWDLLLQVLDDGRLTAGSGPPVNFRNTFVIATSNVGAQALERRVAGFTGGAPGEDADRLLLELEAVFRPELLNRFQHIVRFLRLSKDEVTQIARAELKRALEREGIVARRLAVDVDDEVIDLAVSRGYDEKYGARALKRQLQQLVIMPIATLLMERAVDEGSILRVTARHAEVKVAVLEGEISRERRRESAPLRLADGQKVGRDALLAQIEDARAQLEAIATGVKLEDMQRQREELEGRRLASDLWKDPPAAAQVLETCDRIDRVIKRIQRLQSEQREVAGLLGGSIKRDDLARIADRIQIHAGYVEQAHRELLYLGNTGICDAMLEVRPIGNARAARDLLYRTYRSWCDERRYRVLMGREPMSDEEAVMVVVSGPYAFGYLRGEAGHHRIRDGRGTCAAKVSVAAIDRRSQELKLSVQKALKQLGQYGGRVRSRVEVEARDFVLQNANSLVENREWMLELAASWLGAPLQPDLIVRRYDLEPFLLKDYLTDVTTGRSESLQPTAFHRLLCQRIDTLATTKP